MKVPCPPGTTASPLGGCTGGVYATPGGSNFETDRNFGRQGFFVEVPGGYGMLQLDSSGNPIVSQCVKLGIPVEICQAGYDAIVNWARGGGGGSNNMQTDTGGCPQGYEKRGSECVPVGGGGNGTDQTPGTRTPAEGAGTAVMGRYGAGMIPYQIGQIKSKDGVGPIYRCLPGMVLGTDNICYDSLRKSERKWPPGRKPLLTGGELNAITKASRAATRLYNTKKRIRKLNRMIAKASK